MISKGANEWNYGLHGPYRCGHVKLAELMISKDANEWNYGLYAAYLAVHSEFVKSLIDNGGSNWNKLSKSFLNNRSMIHSDLVQLMISKGPIIVNVIDQLGSCVN